MVSGRTRGPVWPACYSHRCVHATAHRQQVHGQRQDTRSSVTCMLQLWVCLHATATGVLRATARGVPRPLQPLAHMCTWRSWPVTYMLQPM